MIFGVYINRGVLFLLIESNYYLNRRLTGGRKGLNFIPNNKIQIVQVALKSLYNRFIVARGVSIGSVIKKGDQTKLHVG